MSDEGSSDIPPPESGRPGPSWGLLQAVAIGALMTIAAGMLLDAAPALSPDQRLIVAGIALLLAALLGISATVYRGPR